METVLIVDDSASNIDILLETLRYDYKVKVANSGQKALEVVEESDDINLILLDIMMPEIDGYNVCRQLKRNRKYQDIPVIFVTALSEVGQETKGFELGAVDYITKPISPPVVRARVKTHIELSEQNKKLDNLLEQTLSGGIKSVTEILAATRPTAYSKSQHFKNLFVQLSAEFVIKDRWKYEIAASLSQLGCVFIPNDIVEKFNEGKPLSRYEMEKYGRYPDFSCELIEQTPFLNDIGKIIGELDVFGNQEEWMSKHKKSSIGLILLQSLVFYDAHVWEGMRHKEILDAMHEVFPKEILNAFEHIDGFYSPDNIVMLWDLKAGMVLSENIYSNDGAVLIPKGETLTERKLNILIKNWKGLKNRTVKIKF